MRHLVLGTGEVGTALKQVLYDGGYEVVGIDKDGTATGKFECLHICFPPIKKFSTTIRDYVKKYGAENALVIIHSSVRVGTTDRINNAVHSPIRGVHPHLADGIKTFTKFFGGARAQEAALIFSEIGIKTHVCKNARTSEALKLCDTTQYGKMIETQKGVKEFCDLVGADFDEVYVMGNSTYNEGYRQLGMPHVARPILRHIEGPIGGHCVRQNAKLMIGSLARNFLTWHKRLFGEK